MPIISALRLEKDLYRDECATHREGRESEIKYYIVTNTELFEKLFQVLASQKRSMGRKKKEVDLSKVPEEKRAEVEAALKEKDEGRHTRSFQQKINWVYEALEEKSSKTSIERIGFNNEFGLVDLIQIPNTSPEHNRNTPFEGQETPIVIFRTYQGGQRHRDVWHKTFTGLDLEYISQVQGGEPPLTIIKDLFIQGRDGTSITAVERLLSKNAVPDALEKLRPAIEEMITRWTEHCLLQRGEGYVEPEDRKYVGYAKSKEVISSSDYAQAVAFLHIASSTLHRNRDYSRLHAMLGHHWAVDFADRTIGHINLEKTRERGTSSSDFFDLTSNSREYLIIRSIFNNLQKIKRESTAQQAEDFKVYLKDESGDPKSVGIEELANSALRVIETVAPYVELNSGDRALMETVKFWKRQVRRNATEAIGLTAQDAIRLATFSYTFFYESEEDSGRANKLHPIDRVDPNYHLGVREKSRARRYTKYGLKSFEKDLRKDLDLVTNVAHTYFEPYLEHPPRKDKKS